jgi:imidazole glycerol-phosphate synthase subunit HisH
MGPKVAVLDYGIGNLRSAQKGLEKVGADARLTSDPAEIEAADGVVLPGVGAFGRCMEALGEHGLVDIAKAAAGSGRPFFGICIGMQMLYEGSDESPGAAGLGVLAGSVRLIPGDVKRPQMQWNMLDIVVHDGNDVGGVGEPAMFVGLDRPIWVYFVHSYAAEPSADVVATCRYGGPVTAAVSRDRLWATQFHPEKSGASGLRILANFVASL